MPNDIAPSGTVGPEERRMEKGKKEEKPQLVLKYVVL